MVKLHDVRLEVVPDEAGDASYLEQPEFADRLAQYREGAFGFVGVRVVAELHIPANGPVIVQNITSPGLWGIEDDSERDYFREVAGEECTTLAAMLQALGVYVSADELRSRLAY